MAYPVPGQCPVCGDEMAVTRLRCRQCDTVVEGQFSLDNPFARLSAQQLSFAELFIRCEGKLTRVGEELNLSYPTVRSRLNDLIRALGYEVEEAEEEQDAERRRSILSDLSAGKITAEQAIKLLKKV
ncbi:MAG: DUF2089 domain-containing protein [Chloroflexi bacterium]|nr:MAG: DUF2089 domain-containing protein [Chloroflexota bacterium]